MKTYFFKLVPPRPSFARDMTEAERKLMGEHSKYWRGLMEQGIALAFGPVLAPEESYGIGIIEVPDVADPRSVTQDDPVIKADTGFRFEIRPMPQVVIRGR